MPIAGIYGLSDVIFMQLQISYHGVRSCHVAHPFDAGRSVDSWRYRAVYAIVAEIDIDSSFANGQYGLGKTVPRDAVKIVEWSRREDVQLPGELVDERLVGPIYRFCGGSD